MANFVVQVLQPGQDLSFSARDRLISLSREQSLVPISKPGILVGGDAHGFTRIKWNSFRENTSMNRGRGIAPGFKFFFMGEQVLFNLLNVRRVPALVHQIYFYGT